MTDEPGSGLSRRGLLGLAGAGAAGLAIGGVGATAIATSVTKQGTSGAAASYPFFGEHQAGVTTPAQDRLHFAAYDMAAGATVEDLRELLADWTYAASRMARNSSGDF